MKFKALLILLFPSLLFLTGCSDKDDLNPGTGRMSIQLTDAPFPYDLVAEANVTIFKIDARNKDHENEASGEVHMAEGSSFVVLMEEDVNVNLLDLTNGVTEMLVVTDVPVGEYDLVRIYVKGINVVLTDGTTYDLDVPSGAQTGIKVFVKPGIVVTSSLSGDLLLDFNVGSSFVAKGNSMDLAGITSFNFKPVIKASNLSSSGSLEGTVTTTQDNMQTGLEGAQVSVFAADTLNTTTFTDEAGAYMVMGLQAGSYDVEVAREGYDPAATEGINITAANKTVVDFELQTAPEPSEAGN